MEVVPLGTILYRGGNPGRWFTFNRQVARKYGNINPYHVKKTLKLFILNHTSIKKLEGVVSPETFKLLKFAFGTNTTKKKQLDELYKKYKISISLSPGKMGSRLSIKSIDNKVMLSLASEFLTKNGYDGVYMPEGKFHSEMFVTRPAEKIARKTLETTKQSSRSIQTLFAMYTKRTSALRLYYKNLYIFLHGGMAVKFFLGKKASKITKNTEDFDFKFAVDHPLKTKEEVAKYTGFMKKLMFRHVLGFAKFLLKNGYRKTAPVEMYKIAGVKLDVPEESYKKQKNVYSVYRFKIGPHELIDASLGYDKELKRSDFFEFSGMMLLRPEHMFKETVGLLSRSFTNESAKLRNPLIGQLKEKGLKNVSRVRNLLKEVGVNASMKKHSVKLLETIKIGNYKTSKEGAIKITQLLAARQ
jgi:hypothetical protein